MSNDVLNYSIQINEYLYKNGFENVSILTFAGDGSVIHKNDISMKSIHTLTQYPAISLYDCRIAVGLNNSYSLTNIFIANEPNFYIDRSYAINRIMELDFYIQIKSRYFVMLSSDFNHFHFIDHIKKYNNVLVVYFFFQGYLAYQWYRQYKMYKPFTDGDFEFKYNSQSRIIDKMRAYRLYLTSKLSEYDILNQGQVSCSWSCPDTENTVPEILEDQYCFLNPVQRGHVREHLLQNLPLRFDKFDHDVIPNTSFEIDLVEMSKSFLHVVNETVFYESFNHLTEKTFKPIVCMRPFILVSTPGSLAYLKRYGFKSFDTWIDESYDQEPDQHKRLDMIAEQVRKICLLSMEEISAMYEEMLPVLEWNYNLFYGSFEQDILDELVQNYGDAVAESGAQGPT